MEEKGERVRVVATVVAGVMLVVVGEGSGFTTP